MGRRPRMSVILWVVVLAAGLASGISLASDCDMWYCDDTVPGCLQRQESMTDLCCRDEDGNEVFHCITCDRYEYLCDGYAAYGPAVNCHTPEDVCQ